MGRRLRFFPMRFITCLKLQKIKMRLDLQTLFLGCVLIIETEWISTFATLSIRFANAEPISDRKCCFFEIRASGCFVGSEVSCI